MSTDLIDHLLSSYGLIKGSLKEVSDDLRYKKIMENSEFELVKETTDFNDVILYLNDLQEKPTKYVLFQHTPGWVIMLSNSKSTDNFAKYQESISSNLKRETIRVVDKDQTHIFTFVNENAQVTRDISAIKKDDNLIFSDKGDGFSDLKFKKFNSNHLSELIKITTKYDQNLQKEENRKFVLIKEDIIE